MSKLLSRIVLLAVVALIAGMLAPSAAAKGKPDNPGGHTETVGNNLSYPVIWAEGVTKTLRGEAGQAPQLEGEWWYQWGTNGIDPNVTPASCAPDPDEGNEELNPAGEPYCDDNTALSLTMTAGVPVADDPLPLARAYVQKDAFNVWQAGSFAPEEAVKVDLIDWGDNLESVDWYTKSMVRTEVVLFEDATDGDPEEYEFPMLEYEMRHTSGWGITEVHGLAADLSGVAQTGPGTRATVYSPCARLTIQKLLVDRDDLEFEDLTWVAQTGWTEADDYEGDDLINAPIFNLPVWEGGDGPGYYSAEINVKGRVIYGYTWNVKKLNDEGAGDYRITFSFDQTCGSALSLNTFFVDDITEIIVPEEEELEAAATLVAAESEPGGGATGVLVTDDNLTYIDVRILERSGGGGGGGGSGGGGSGGGGGGGGGGGRR